MSYTHTRPPSHTLMPSNNKKKRKENFRDFKGKEGNQQHRLDILQNFYTRALTAALGLSSLCQTRLFCFKSRTERSGATCHLQELHGRRCRRLIWRSRPKLCPDIVWQGNIIPAPVLYLRNKRCYQIHSSSTALLQHYNVSHGVSSLCIKMV